MKALSVYTCGLENALETTRHKEQEGGREGRTDGRTDVTVQMYVH